MPIEMGCAPLHCAAPLKSLTCPNLNGEDQEIRQEVEDIVDGDGGKRPPELVAIAHLG